MTPPTLDLTVLTKPLGFDLALSATPPESGLVVATALLSHVSSTVFLTILIANFLANLPPVAEIYVDQWPRGRCVMKKHEFKNLVRPSTIPF